MPEEFIWTEEAIENLCDRIAGGDAVMDIAGKHGLPSEATIYRAMKKNPALARSIAHAREAQQEHEMEYCIALADSATPEDHQVKKLQIWARQWRAGKLLPKTWGDKIEIDSNVTVTEGDDAIAKKVASSPALQEALKRMLDNAGEVA